MANDLATAKDEILKALVTKAGSGIRSYTFGNRTVVHHSPEELLRAYLSIAAAGQAGAASPITRVEVEDF